MLQRLFARIGRAFGIVGTLASGQSAYVGAHCPHCVSGEVGQDEPPESRWSGGGWLYRQGQVGRLIVRRLPQPKRGQISYPERIETRLGCSICGGGVQDLNTREGDRCPWCDKYHARYVVYEKRTPGRTVPTTTVLCWLECSQCGWRPNDQTWKDTIHNQEV